MVKNLFRFALSSGILFGLMWTSLPPKALAVDSVGSAVTFACSDTEAAVAAKNGPRVTSGDTTIYIGYRQLGLNKDPIAASFTNGVQDWCRTDYEVTGDDNTGYGLYWDGTPGGLYGVFSATGTQGTAEQDFRRFATGGWLRSYSDASTGGGGAKVAIVAHIDPATGDVWSATFITARKSDGKVNSVGVQGLTLDHGYLRVSADSWWSPRNPDRSRMECTGDSPFDYTLWLKPDLSGAIYASAVGCTGNGPAPVEGVTLVPEIGFVGQNRFRAIVAPVNAQQPVTFTWSLNGAVVRTRAVSGNSDVFTHTWSTLTLDQRIHVTATNALVDLLGGTPAATSAAFDVVEAQRVYLPVVLR